MRSGFVPRPQAAVLTNAAAWLAAAWSWPGVVTDNPHTRRVALLKRLLPAIGLLLLLLIAVWPQMAPLWQRMRFAFPAIDLHEAKELRMVNPRYAGVDRLGRPYLVTAAIGRQAPERQDLMSLEAPRADIKVHADADLVVTALTGIYQSQAQLLDLFGEVTLVRQDGTRFVTNSARVNVADNTAEGSEPVAGHGPSGDVNSAGFRITDKGAAIIFTGKSDMLLRGAAKANVQSHPPAALPPRVAAAAKQAEVEAKPLLAAKPAAKTAPAQGRQAAKPATQRSAATNPGARPTGRTGTAAKSTAATSAAGKSAGTKPAAGKVEKKV